MNEGGQTNPRMRETIAPPPTVPGQQPVTVPLTSADEASRAHDEPKQIGPYAILRRLGEGGMGVVYRADQTAPVKRQVALKLIKLGMDTREVIARFESERQALAVLNHPNIARVYDAGATPTGRPYFVMELVPGEPITTFCDAHRYDTRNRLELFLQVCEAVQHAHRKGIIHRDLKPTNILVALADGKPQAKVIDFGVAKATDQRLTERTVFTEHGQLIGTPEYMSPEQATASSALDIDTRTDVYSLGVLLYELLSGALPFDGKTLRRGAYAELQRVIREVEPPRPSTRLSSLGGGDSSSIAKKRNASDGRTLVRQIRGDLDWITMRAMEKDRARRYGSASELADDIRRHLKSEPVTAGPPSATYIARKFVRRHRAPVLAASVALLALLASFGVATWQAIRATRAEHAVRIEQQRTAEQAQRAEARFQQVRALANTMLFDLDKLIRPLPGASKPRKLLVETAQQYLDNLSADPSADDKLLQELVIAYQKLGDIQGGGTGLNLGDTVGAEASFNKARALAEELLKRRPSDPAARRQYIIGLYDTSSIKLRRGQIAEALAERRKWLEESEKIYAENPGVSTYRRDVALAAQGVGDILDDMGRYDEAEPLLRRSIDLSAQAAAEKPDDVEPQRELANAHMVLGEMYLHHQDYPHAYDVFSTALSLRRKLLEANPDNARVISDTALGLERLGDVLHYQEKDDEALPYYQQSMELRAKTAAADPDNASAQRDLAIAHTRLAKYKQSSKQYEDAMAEYRIALQICEALLAKDSTSWLARRDVAANRLFIADCLAGLKRYAEALPEYEAFLSFAQALVERDGSKVNSQMDLAKAHEMMAQNLLDLSDTLPEPAHKVEHVRRARGHYEQARQVAARLHEAGKLPKADQNAVASFAEKVAACDKELAQLSAAANPTTQP